MMLITELSHVMIQSIEIITLDEIDQSWPIHPSRTQSRSPRLNVLLFQLHAHPHKLTYWIKGLKRHASNNLVVNSFQQYTPRRNITIECS